MKRLYRQLLYMLGKRPWREKVFFAKREDFVFEAWYNRLYRAINRKGYYVDPNY